MLPHVELGERIGVRDRAGDLHYADVVRVQTGPGLFRLTIDLAKDDPAELMNLPVTDAGAGA